MVDEAALKELRRPFAPEQIGHMPRGGITIDFVGHAAVTNRLLEVDPLWTWEPVAFDEHGLPAVDVSGDQAVLWIRLTVCGVTRYGVGTTGRNDIEVHKVLIGDAIRNAAMRFGVAIDLWSKEDLLVESSPADRLRNQIAEVVSGWPEAKKDELGFHREERGWPTYLADYTVDQLEEALMVVMELATKEVPDDVG